MRLLIVKLSSLGDLFHALPTVHALKEGLTAEIDWAVQPEYAELVRCFTDVSRVVPIPRRDVRHALPGAMKALRAARYDAVVDLQGLFKSALVTRLARAPRRVGPSYSRECAALFYTQRVPRGDPGQHAVDQAMDVLASFRLPRPARPCFPLAFPAYALPDARPRIGLLPVSRWQTKNWPVGHYVALARQLADSWGARVYVLGSRDDAEVAETICKAAPTAIQNLCGRLTLPQLGGVLGQLDLLVANDSGPVHLAAALGTPCLVLFGPTFPARTGPYGPNHRVMQLDLACQPCRSRTCRVGGIPCLANIRPEQVFTVAEEMRARRPLQPSVTEPAPP